LFSEEETFANPEARNTSLFRVFTEEKLDAKEDHFELPVFFVF